MLNYFDYLDVVKHFDIFLRAERLYYSEYDEYFDHSDNFEHIE